MPTLGGLGLIAYLMEKYRRSTQRQSPLQSPIPFFLHFSILSTVRRMYWIVPSCTFNSIAGRPMKPPLQDLGEDVAEGILDKGHFLLVGRRFVKRCCHGPRLKRWWPLFKKDSRPRGRVSPRRARNHASQCVGGSIVVPPQP